MKAIKFILLGIVALCFMASSLLAGVYMTGTVKNNGKIENMEMFVEQDRMRFETITEQGKQIVIYRDDLKKFWVVNNGKYMEMTEEDMKKMGEQMSGAMKMMEEKMQGLTKEQQEMMQKYMKGKMPGQSQETKTEWKKVGGEKVNEWNCDKYESNDGKTVWTAQPEELGVTKNDFQVFDKAQDFFSELTKNNDSFLKYTSTDDSDGLSGFPVKTITSKGQEQTLNEVTKKDLDKNLFELHKEWEKQDSPMMQMK